MVTNRVKIAVLFFLGVFVANEVQCVVILMSSQNSKGTMKVHNDGRTPIVVEGPGGYPTTVPPGNAGTISFQGVGPVSATLDGNKVVESNIGQGGSNVVYVSGKAPQYGVTVLSMVLDNISLVQTATTLTMSIASGSDHQNLAISETPGNAQSISVSEQNISISQGPEPDNQSLSFNGPNGQNTSVSKHAGTWSVAQTY